mmetsp:Transcript_65741/g.77279  ORF Transcript_65741/g.77279 Transcript_65741/m.77279 type:complete len:86 (-) Transcript_65741:88-345(-)
MPPPHMLAFHLVNGLKFPRKDFVTILTDLQGNSPNSKPWYIGWNLVHTLYKALAHQEACTNILKLVTPKVSQNEKQQEGYVHETL